MTGLLKLRDELFSLEARQGAVQNAGGSFMSQCVTAEAFKPILGADKSLKRKESFVDKFMKRGRSQPNAKKKCKRAESGPIAAPFVRIITVKESDQAKLDKAALKCIDLNSEPDWHFTAAMGQAKKQQKKDHYCQINVGNYTDPRR
ncbi:unnamed protein product [Calypogeia fissa]